MSPRPLPLEIWGGIECTVNRVGDQYFDQVERCGHSLRVSDVDAIADLGIRVVRYPVLWERTAPHGVDRAEWRWADERLARLRARGIEPILGLVHHGSGPPWTSLLDPGFPAALAAYASAVARRYPWVRRWTPINEPLTTARFSTLYGVWYPHARDDRAFARALLTQCRAVAQAMRAIRRVVPDAELVQTEDLGRVHGTPPVQYQVDFENERRWLTFDLLYGRVDRAHPLWDYLRWAGLSADELGRFREEAVAPDILGINHYVTSDRWLDDRLDHHPPATHGGNGQDRYADVEAVRAIPGRTAGPMGALADTWARYARPLAVTEAHLGGTREQQLRWLHEVWEATIESRRNGADVRAVTIWSLLGAYDWHNLVTCNEGCYEVGAFDARAVPPRPTAVARMVRDLAATGGHAHAVLASPGWWRDEVPSYGPARVSAGRRTSRGVLVTGAAGTLGAAFGRICDARRIDRCLTTRADLDIADPLAVDRVLDSVRPWAVVNAAGYVRVDDAEREDARCTRENASGPGMLAEACALRGIQFVTFSTDLVFDGLSRTPYVESDAPRPLCAYGRSKAAAERCVLHRMPDALVIRTAAFFGPWDEHHFLSSVLRSLRLGESVRAADDQVVSPTYVPDLVDAALDLLIDRERGIWHLTNSGAVTWADFARAAAERAGLDADLIQARPTARLGLAAIRPAYSVLRSERVQLLPSLDDALLRYFATSGALDPVTAPSSSFS